MEKSAAQITSDLSAGLAKLEGVMLSSLLVVVLIGVVVVFVTQIMKAPLSYLILMAILKAWLPRGIASADFVATYKSPPTWLRPPTTDDKVSLSNLETYDKERLERYFSNISKFLPPALYLKEIQNRVHQILERPSDNIPLFLAVTRGASPFDQAVTCIVHEEIRKNPAWFASLQKKSDSEPKDGSRPSGYEVAVVTAQDHVAASAERNLDDLQIKITVNWKLGLRAGAVGLGILVGLVGGRVAGIPTDAWWLLGILGGMGGYFSSIIYDAVSIIGRLRRQ